MHRYLRHARTAMIRANVEVHELANERARYMRKRACPRFSSKRSRPLSRCSISPATCASHKPSYRPGGPTLEFYIGVSVPRANALTAAGKQVVPPILVRGLVDTGASCTSVDPSILTALGIVSTGTVPVHTPSTTSVAPHLANQFDISIILAHAKLSWQFHAVPIIESQLQHQGIQALIGRDILQNCLLTYDGQAGLFALAF